MTRCNHNKTTIVRRVHANGSTHVARQCSTCGVKTETLLKSSYTPEQIASLPRWNDNLSSEYQASVRDRFKRKKQAESKAWWRNYQDHMASPKWMEIRDRVLAREHEVCQGCGRRRAVHVHHATYEHVGDEFMFELIAVCKACHERIHRRAL